ncbi:hypothetical protein Tco_0111688 [Tanacetum coccineum]
MHRSERVRWCRGGFGCNMEGDRLQLQDMLKPYEGNYPQPLDLELAAVSFCNEDLETQTDEKMVGTVEGKIHISLSLSIQYHPARLMWLPTQLKTQRDDGELWAIVQNVEDGKHTEFSVDDDGVVWFEDRLCVPNDQALREKVMTEAHSFSRILLSSRFNQDVQRYETDQMNIIKGYVCNTLESPIVKWMRFPWDFSVTVSEAEISSGYVRTAWHTDFCYCVPTEILSLLSFFGKDYRKLRELVLIQYKAYHPQTDGQSERTYRTLEDNGCAKEKLKEARSRQKSYADKHRHDLEFQVGDRVFLKVSPFRGVKRFGIKGKLSPRFMRSVEIFERIGEVSYRPGHPPSVIECSR